MKKLILVLAASMMVLLAGAAAAVENSAYARAVDYYNNGQFRQAVEVLDDYVKRRPEPSAYYLIGYSLYRMGRHNEAAEYFKQAYLIDPQYSPTPALIAEGRWPPESIEGPEVAPPTAPPVESQLALPAQEPVPTPAPEPEPVPTPVPAPEPAPAPVPVPAPEPATAPAPAPESAPVPAPEPAPQAAPQKPAPAPAPEPAAPTRPPVKRTIKPPLGPMAGPMEMLAPYLGMTGLLMGLGIYLFSSLCLFLIARKTGVQAAWTAWIPVIQVYAFVASGGKPWWWILLLLVPFVNIIVMLYLWMCISENLGRNKLLGLLMLLPVINIFYPAFLAFAPAPGAGPGSRTQETDMTLDTGGMPEPPSMDIDEFGFEEEENK